MAIQIPKRKINLSARNKIADEVQFRVDLAEAAIRLQQVTDPLALADLANEEHAERRWPAARAAVAGRSGECQHRRE